MNGLFKLFLLHSFGRRYGSVLIQFLDIFLQKEEGQRCQTYLWDENVAGMSEHGFEEEDVSGADLCQRYYLQDELGSPLRFVGADGILTETYGYDEFGCDIYQNQGREQPFGYTGYQYDSAAGTYYAQAREYVREARRFAGQEKVLKPCPE